MSGLHGGNYARSRFGKLHEFLCIHKFHFLSGGVGWNLSLVEKLGCFLLEQPQVVVKTASEKVVMTEKLPAVGETAWSRFLPSLAEVVVVWRFSDFYTESRCKDE